MCTSYLVLHGFDGRILIGTTLKTKQNQCHGSLKVTKNLLGFHDEGLTIAIHSY